MGADEIDDGAARRLRVLSIRDVVRLTKRYFPGVTFPDVALVASAQQFATQHRLIVVQTDSPEYRALTAQAFLWLDLSTAIRRR